jgi:LysR family transcriptional regulator, benzoate and cis,cis-muconate-responsive activator of ben and cat genes
MRHMNKNEQLLNLRNHSIHICIIRHVNDEPGITTHTIAKEPIYLAVAKTHALAKSKSVAMKLLATDSLIVFPRDNRPSFADQTIAECRKVNFVPNIIQETEDVISTLVLVSVGLGVALFPHSACNIKIPDVKFIPLNKADFYAELSCIHLTERRAPVLEAFLKIIQDNSS